MCKCEKCINPNCPNRIGAGSIDPNTLGEFALGELGEGAMPEIGIEFEVGKDGIAREKQIRRMKAEDDGVSYE